MNESFAKSRYDYLLFAFLFVFTSPTEHCGLENSCGPYRATVADFHTFEPSFLSFFFFWNGSKNTCTYMYVYIYEACVLTSLRSWSLIAASWGPGTQVRHTTLLKRGAYQRPSRPHLPH
jgi:hypothetical protein